MRDWLSDVWMAVWTTITSRQRWPSYDGDKRSYVKEKKTREERKKSGVENRAFKGLQNDKEIEWGGRKDNVTRRGENSKEWGQKEKHWIETGSDIFQVETADENWQVQVKLGVVLYAEDFPLHPPLTTKGNGLKWYNSTIKPDRGEERAEGRREGEKTDCVVC